MVKVGIFSAAQIAGLREDLLERVLEFSYENQQQRVRITRIYAVQT